jgi:hypothetical protein
MPRDDLDVEWQRYRGDESHWIARYGAVRLEALEDVGGWTAAVNGWPSYRRYSSRRGAMLAAERFADGVRNG